MPSCLYFVLGDDHNLIPKLRQQNSKNEKKKYQFCSFHERFSCKTVQFLLTPSVAKCCRGRAHYVPGLFYNERLPTGAENTLTRRNEKSTKLAGEKMPKEALTPRDAGKSRRRVSNVSSFIWLKNSNFQSKKEKKRKKTNFWTDLNDRRESAWRLWARQRAEAHGVLSLRAIDRLVWRSWCYFHTAPTVHTRASRVDGDVLAAAAELGPGSLVIPRRYAQAVMSPANILFSAGGLVVVAAEGREGGREGTTKFPSSCFNQQTSRGTEPRDSEREQAMFAG